MTKKDVYRLHGIKAMTEKGRTYLLHDIFGTISPLLVNGNEKLGKGVWTFSTLPTNGGITVNMGTRETPDVRTINGTCPCHCPGCYATTGCYRFNPTKKALAIRTLIARADVEWFRRAVIAQIKADGIKIVRIHAAGDFFSDEYIQAWRDICTACPDTMFWSYTKNADAENAFDDIPNCNIVKSIVPDCGLNYGKREYILAAYETLKKAKKSVHICRCGIDSGQHCTNCHGCSCYKYVLFVEHSTAYDAEKDPAFETLKNVIESQPAV